MRSTDLLQDPVAHDGDPVGHRHALELVVRDVDGRGAQGLLDVLELAPHPRAQLGVQVGDGLVEQERLRLADQNSPDGHALLLATGQLSRSPIQQALDLEDLGGLGDPPVDLVLRHLAQPQRVGHVLVHRLLGVQRIRLEHHRDVAVPGFEVVDPLATELDVALGDELQPGDHPQRGRFTASGRAQQAEELAVGDLQVEVSDGLDLVVPLPHAVERQSRHDISWVDLCRSSGGTLLVGVTASPLPW